MPEITLAEAVTQALAYELKADENVILMGEDIGLNGGVFRVTDGLQKTFGKDRVIDTPLAEAMIAGLSIGMATKGLRPVAEFQFLGFIAPAFEQITSHAARWRNRHRGRVSCPLVFRAPYGGGIRALELHGESSEAWFAHQAGLRVVIPSTPAKAYGLLLASIRNNDPVLFLEPKRVYRWVKQDVPDDGQELPLDRCFIVREGSDVTLVAWGAMMKETLETADKLKEQGVSCEVIDVATIKPLDMETILASVEKTGRCVIVHEAARFCGVGAEIAAQLAEKAFVYMQAPVQRVTGYDTIPPYFRLEKHYIPSVERIEKAIKKTLDY